MGFKILISPRAIREIEHAIDYYSLNSADAPAHFIHELQSAFSILETNPFFRIRYNTIRAMRLKRFPHSLYFIIDEDEKTVLVLSCFHNKQNTNKRP